MKARLEACVHGLVQGVGFRYFVMRNANLLGLTGYAENLPDGSVFVVAEGERSVLEELLKLLKKGSAMSVVDKVEYSFKDHVGEFVRFEVF